MTELNRNCETSTFSAALSGATHADTIGAMILSFLARQRARAADRRARAKKAWLRHVTEREIAKLPPETRKDIGWPTRRDDL